MDRVLVLDLHVARKWRVEQRRTAMLFMTVFTYEPGARDEVIHRRVEKGAMIPKGMKLLGEWSHVGSGRVFRLIDVEDPAALPEVTMPWTDIGNLDVYPVMEVETI